MCVKVTVTVNELLATSKWDIGNSGERGAQAKGARSDHCTQLAGVEAETFIRMVSCQVFL